MITMEGFIEKTTNLHCLLYNGINKILELYILKYLNEKITPNKITYFRTCLVFPAVYLFFLPNDYMKLISSILIMTNDFLDFLDGAVARVHEKKGIVYNKIYGSYIDACGDKLFNIIFWSAILIYQHKYSVSAISQITQYVFISLILIETILGFVRTKLYLSNKVSHADKYGKTKQTLETIGTSLYILYFIKTNFILKILFFLLSNVGISFLIFSIYFSLRSLYNKFVF